MKSKKKQITIPHDVWNRLEKHSRATGNVSYWIVTAIREKLDREQK